MRNVVTSKEIGHLWAHQTQTSARSAASVSFEGPDFYSYSTVIASIVTGKDGTKAFLHSKDRYSNTTSKHQCWARQAAFGREFYIPGTSRHNNDTFSNPARILAAWTEEVKDKLSEGSRAREPKKTRLILEASQLVDLMREFAEFMGLKKVKYPALPNSVAELASMMEIEEKRKAAAAKKAEARRNREEAAARLDAFPKMEAWLRGENVDTWSFGRYYDTLLRVFGDQVETSKGAAFPVSHAKRGLALVEAVRNGGKEWVRNGHTCHLGHYQIDRIEPNGTVHAGCHLVSYAAIERIAPEVIAA